MHANAPPENGRAPQAGQPCEAPSRTVGTDDERQCSDELAGAQRQLAAVADLYEPPWSLTVTEHERCADFLRAIGVQAVSMEASTWLNELPADGAPCVLLVDRAARVAGDLQRRGVTAYCASTPLPYRYPSEFLERRAEVEGYRIDGDELRELWRMVEDGAQTHDVEATGHVAFDVAPAATANNPAAEEAEPEIQGLGWEQVAELPPIEWVAEGWLPALSLVLLAGEPACGKSFALVDFSLRMVHGMPWLGVPTRPGSVLYLAGEGFAGLAGRLRAWREHHQPTAAQRGDRYFRLLDGIPVLSKKGAKKVRQVVAKSIAEAGSPPAVIVVDTLSQALEDGDENEAKVVGPALRILGSLRKKYGCTIVVVHHLAKPRDGRPAPLTAHAVRGSSALVGNVDVVLGLSVDGDGLRTMQALKCKDSEVPPRAFFRLLPVATGRARTDGQAERSCVVIPADPPKDTASPIDSDRKVLEALRLAAEEGATRAQVVDITGLDQSTAWDALNRLVKSGAAWSRKAKPVRYWLAEFAPRSGDDPGRSGPNHSPDHQPTGAGRSDDPDDPAPPKGGPDRITGSSKRARQSRKTKRRGRPSRPAASEGQR